MKDEKRKVIKRNNLPIRLPLNLVLIVWLFLAHYKPAGWVYGVVITLLAIICIFAMVAISQENDIDIFEEENK